MVADLFPLHLDGMFVVIDMFIVIVNVAGFFVFRIVMVMFVAVLIVDINVDVLRRYCDTMPVAFFMRTALAERRKRTAASVRMSARRQAAVDVFATAARGDAGDTQDD